jgi:hypothetical protein
VSDTNWVYNAHTQSAEKVVTAKKVIANIQLAALPTFSQSQLNDLCSGKNVKLTTTISGLYLIKIYPFQAGLITFSRNYQLQGGSVRPTEAGFYEIQGLDADLSTIANFTLIYLTFFCLLLVATILTKTDQKNCGKKMLSFSLFSVLLLMAAGCGGYFFGMATGIIVGACGGIIVGLYSFGSGSKEKYSLIYFFGATAAAAPGIIIGISASGLDTQAKVNADNLTILWYIISYAVICILGLGIQKIIYAAKENRAYKNIAL